MDREQVLSKKAILNGVQAEETVSVPSLGGRVTIQPLTSGQWAKIEAIRTRGLNVGLDNLSPSVLDSGDFSEAVANDTDAKVRVDLNMEAMTEANFEADAYAVSCGLLGSWSLVEVKSIRPPAAVEEIAKEVYRISNVEPEDLTKIATFREESGGPGDSGAE